MEVFKPGAVKGGLQILQLQRPDRRAEVGEGWGRDRKATNLTWIFFVKSLEMVYFQMIPSLPNTL